MKRVLIMAAAFVAQSSHAGFLVGVALGAALNSGGGAAPPLPPPTQLFASDQHDVILCQQKIPGTCVYNAAIRGADRDGRGGVYDNPSRCSPVFDPWFRTVELTCTPQQYTVNAGFKTLHKIGSTLLPNGTVMLVLEVSR